MCTPPLPFAGRSATQTQSVLVVELGRAHFEQSELAARLRAAGFHVSRVAGAELSLVQHGVRPGIIVVAEREWRPAVEVCRKLRVEPSTADSAILLMTTERSVEALEAALVAGFDDFLPSAVDAALLLESLRAALALRAARGLVADWAALKEHRERALRQQLWAERLGALLVHDLKAPLNVIDLLAQGLLRHGSLSEPRREAVSNIRHQSKRLANMVVELLDISRAREGVLRANPINLDAQELCRELLRDFSVAAASKDVTLDALSFTAGVHADPELLRRALANLIDNAVQHARPGGTVTVVLSPRVSHTELRVSDDGPGVPPELREAVFEPFKQGEAASTHGRGLGLTFCKLAATAHGGRIWLEDETEGTVVVMALPRPDILERSDAQP